MHIVMIEDPIDVGWLWQVRGKGSAVLGSADDSEGARGKDEGCRKGHQPHEMAVSGLGGRG
jgi:hypothetical protein